MITSNSLLPAAKRIGYALAVKRVEQSLSQADVANLTGLSVDTIQRIESGKISIKFESFMKYMTAVDARLPAEFCDLVES